MNQKQDFIQRNAYSSYGKTKLEKIANDRSTVAQALLLTILPLEASTVADIADAVIGSFLN